MKLKIAALAVVALVVTQSAQAVPNEDNNGHPKVTICHVPPGNPANAHTITIGPKAAIRHLANHPGDRLGACPGECPCNCSSSSSECSSSSSSEGPCPDGLDE